MLSAMPYFIRTAEFGSLSAAARKKGMAQSAMSKSMDALKAHLQVRLLERSTTGLTLANQGPQFYERARLLLEEYEAAVCDARGLTEQRSGLLKVNAPVAFGQTRLNALVHRFLDAHPTISVELILDDRCVDLVAEGVDIGVRLGARLPRDAVASASPCRRGCWQSRPLNWPFLGTALPGKSGAARIHPVCMGACGRPLGPA